LKEPYPGWLDNISAASAFYLFIALGISTFSVGKMDLVNDQIPVDLVADAVIVAAAYYANTK